MTAKKRVEPPQPVSVEGRLAALETRLDHLVALVSRIDQWRCRFDSTFHRIAKLIAR